MNIYNTTITFKDRKFLSIRSEADDDLRDILHKELENEKESWLRIGDYFIAKKDVLHIKIEGDKELEKHIRKELPDTGKEVK